MLGLTKGKVTQIYPNSFQKDNFVKANREVEIPSADSKAEIKIAGDLGGEVVKVFATNKQAQNRARRRGHSWTDLPYREGKRSRDCPKPGGNVECGSRFRFGEDFDHQPGFQNRRVALVNMVLRERP